MKKIEIIVLSSGFANVANEYTFAENYYGNPIAAREDSGYDKSIYIEVPDGYKFVDDVLLTPDGYTCNAWFFRDAITMESGKIALDFWNDAREQRTEFYQVLEK